MRIAIVCLWIAVGALQFTVLNLQQQLKESATVMDSRISSVRIELNQTVEQVRCLQRKGECWMYVPNHGWQRVSPHKDGFIYVETPEMRQMKEADCQYTEDGR
ncbi:MAG: hypothetical protein KBA18_09115 [Kiritimatiellae bacterium]|nr:hypothetical protein [Kiritimatiellia bacterium]